MSFIHNDSQTCEVSFSNSRNIHIKYYPRFRVTSNKLVIDYQSGTHETTFTSDFQNKQLFIWICYNGSVYKIALCNYASRVVETRTPPVNFMSNQFEIDYSSHVLRVGFIDTFLDVDSLEFHRISLEEKRNGSYFQ